MNKIYEQEKIILISNCNSVGKLSYHALFNLFIDIANEHAHFTGIGYHDLLKKDSFWIAAQTRINITSLPIIGDKVMVKTWTEAPNGYHVVRHYVLANGNGVLACGKTLWVVKNIKTGNLTKLNEVLNSSLEFSNEKADEKPFTRFPRKIESEYFSEYVVKYTDIDVGQHMNNTAYIHALEGLFSVSESNAICPKSIEIEYLKPCFEGDTLRINKAKTENGLIFTFENGSIATIAKIEL